MFNIKSVIRELEKKTNGVFINESHLHIEFAKAIHSVYPHSCNFCFEFYALQKRIDLVVTIDGESIGFEFKYFTKKTKPIPVCNGIKIELKNQVARDLCRINYWKDIKRLEELVNCQIIKKGFAILITNDNRLFNKRINTFDCQFDLSSGIKKPSTHAYLGKKPCSFDILNQYDFQIKKFNNFLSIMINEI